MSSSKAAQPSDYSEFLERCTFPPAGTEVVCAVSGGADSSALLILAVAAGCSAKAVHVDHQLRANSSEEADEVASLASSLGAGFEAVAAPVEHGPNLEERARNARYAALPEGAFIGHTADDQAETVLLNLLRGAGVAGLAGMRRDARRPMLSLRRADTQRICEIAGRTPLSDPSNQDMSYLRNRVRHEVLPLLADLAGRDIVPLLCRTADVCRDAETLLGRVAADIDATDVRALAALAPEEMRWAVRSWVEESTGRPPDLAAVLRILKVAAGDAQATDIAGGFNVRRSRNRLTLREIEKRQSGKEIEKG